jgi:hypothetical protein
MKEMNYLSNFIPLGMSLSVEENIEEFYCES